MTARRTPRLMRLGTMGSLCLVGVFILSACGSSEANSSPVEVSSTSVPTATPTSPPTLDEQFSHKSVWSFENASGYTYDMTIALGDPTPIPEDGILSHPLDGAFMLGSACSVNPKLDIVIPAYWSATATTEGFDTPLSMRALFMNGGSGIPSGKYNGPGVAPYEGDNRVLVEQQFSSTGAECSVFSSTKIFGYAHSDGFSVRWSDPVPKGTVRMNSFFIVVKDYFSPATPLGDVGLLDWIVIKPLFGGDNADAAMVYRVKDGVNDGMTLSGKLITPTPPTPTPSPIPSPTPTALPTQPPRISVGDTVVTTTFTHLREAATPSSTIKDVLQAGTKLTITGRSERDYKSGYVYFQVTVEETGQVGFVNRDAIEPVPGSS
jgi:hypothetical protein